MASEPKKGATHGKAKRVAALRTPKRKAVTKPYEPTPEERAVMEAYLARRRETTPAPRMKVSKKEGVPQLSLDHPEPALGQILLMKALGTTSVDFLDGLLKQLVNAGSRGSEMDVDGLNFMLSVVKGIGPEDEVESMLAPIIPWRRDHAGRSPPRRKSGPVR